MKKYTFLLLIPTILLVSSLISYNYFSHQPTDLDIRSKASGNTLTVNPSDSGTGIQQAVDKASDGDIILIKSGTYTRNDYVPFNVPQEFIKRSSDKCFLNLKGKSLTLLGEGGGSILFGEGHDKPDVEPYKTRIGICTIGGNVTIDRLRIKEFQGGCMFVGNSQITMKNSVMDGCDMGGIQLRGTSKGVFVNNIFVGLGNAGGIGFWENTVARVINNTFYGSQLYFFIHPSSTNPPLLTSINNIIDVNDGAPFRQVDWPGWLDKLPELKKSTYAYNLLSLHDKTCDASKSYCDNFTGRIEGDPMFNDPAVDERGWHWGSFDLKSGSPAIGKGDPSIPGPKDLGFTGGACTDANSSTCMSFIEQQKSLLQPPTNPTDTPAPPPTTPPGMPTNTPVPTSPPGVATPTTSQPTSPPGEPTYTPPPSSVSPTPETIQPTTYNPSTTLSASPPPTTPPSPTPTIKPLIDIKKTVETVKQTWIEFVASVIHFTRTVLP